MPGYIKFFAIIFACGLYGNVRALEVISSGAVYNSGYLQLADNARLADVIILANPTTNAYYPGGMLLRQTSLLEQEKLKIGILYELNVLQQNDVVRSSKSLRHSLSVLNSQIASLKPTGRISARMNPSIVNKAEYNLPLKNHDIIFLPPTPRGIFVLGAVAKPGLYKFKDNSVVNIAHKVKRINADLDWAWLIQPNGKFERIGVALWNHQWEKKAKLGAFIFIPFKRKVMHGTSNFDLDMARFLASQSVSFLTDYSP